MAARACQAALRLRVLPRVARQHLSCERTPAMISSTTNATVRFRFICCTRMTSSSGAARRTSRLANWIVANCFKAERGKLLVIPRPAGPAAAVVVGLGRRESARRAELLGGGGDSRSIAGRRLSSGRVAADRSATQFAFGWAYGQYKFERYRRAESARERCSLRLPPRRRRRRSRATARRDCAGARSHQHACERHVARGTGAGGRRGRASLRSETSRDHRRRSAQGAVPRDSRSRSRSRRRAATRRHRVGRSVASEGHARRQGRVLRHRRPRHQARRIDAADEEGHGRRRGRARARAARSWMRSCRCVCACCCRRSRTRSPRNAYRPGDVLGTRKGLTVEIGNTDAEGRADPLRCAGAGGRREARPADRHRDADGRGTRRARSGAAGAVQQRRCTGARSWCRSRHSRVDPLWRMPLWSALRRRAVEQDRRLNNVSSSGFSGAIFGALFLRALRHRSARAGCTSICMAGTARSGRDDRSARNRRQSARSTLS